MAERWQQWMPFHIDRWKGSPHVQAMRAAARAGYLYLLATAWQTDYCCLPDDDEELMVLAGLTHEEWAQYGPTIRRRFVKTENGLRNEVEFEEWNEAKRVFESRQTNARRTHSKRSSHAEHEHSKSTAPCNADTQTGTGTKTTTKKEQKTSLRQAQSDPRHVPFKLACETYAKYKGVTFVWDGSEAKILASLLAASPDLTLGTFQQCLNHRARSVVTHGERPREWLGTILKYQEGPLDQYGKPQGAGNGNRNQSKTGGNIDAARQALAILAEAERNSSLADEVQHEAGGGGESGDLSHLRAGSIELRD